MRSVLGEHLKRVGRALITELLPRHADHVGGLLEDLDREDRRELRRLLGKLRESLARKFLDGHATATSGTIRRGDLAEPPAETE